jgi:hypothetical protein
MYKLQYSKQRRQNMPEICRFRFCPNAAQTVMWTFLLTISRPVALESLLDPLERESEVWSGILKTAASYVGHKIGIVRAPLRYLRPKGDIDILFSFNAGLRSIIQGRKPEERNTSGQILPCPESVQPLPFPPCDFQPVFLLRHWPRARSLSAPWHKLPRHPPRMP